ncbi:MAG: hypothetical protein NTW49_10115 [Bacteroidia bacterium]|nr:hypothetical protein [Bacteroidia bacterium]
MISTAISLSFFFLFDMVKDGGTGWGTDWQAESIDVKITGYGPGYFYWVLSSVIILTGNLIRIIPPITDKSK